MYRRLKNLLGVSLIILAIILSQMPMPQVQADTNGDEVMAQQVEGDTESGTNVSGDGTDNGVASNDAGQITDEITNTDSAEAEQNAEDNDFNADNGNEVIGLTLTAVQNVNSIMPLGTGDVTVTFEYGFSGAVGSTTVTVPTGSTITAPANITDDTGSVPLTKGTTYKIGGKEYKFWGWHKGKDMSSSPEWDFSDTVSEDMTLYAAWSSQVTYTITYHANDADSTEDKVQTVTVDAGKPIPDVPHIPIRSGYTFVKWTDNVGQDIDWNKVVTDNMDLYASWTDKSYTVTFDVNGGTYNGGTTSPAMTVVANQAIDTTDPTYPTGVFAYDPYTPDDTNWYKDKSCLNIYDMSTPVTCDMTLYKKWTQRTEDGFTLNPDGTVLYLFDGDQENVVIPATVTIIAADSFPDMKNIKRITLPARISDIRENAFSGMESSSFLTRDIYIYASSDGVYDSKLDGKNLADRYEHFIYVSSTDDTGNYTTAEIQKVNCSLADIDRAEDANGNPVYPKVTLPYDLENGLYNLTFAEDDVQIHIADLLKKAGYNTNSGYVYYMDIELKKVGTSDAYKPSWNTGTMTITMPLPTSWHGRDSSKIKMFAVSQDYTKLDEVTLGSFYNNIFSFYPPHFSEYALVYTGTINNSSSGNNGGASSGNSNGGASSDNGSGSSDNNGGASSNSTNSSQSTQTAVQTSATTVQPDVTQPVQPTTGQTQPDMTQSSGTGSSSGGNSHVKDSTPKTGDPLEYRTLLVCGFFSMGVLLLLIGNKKKTSASSRYLRV